MQNKKTISNQQIKALLITTVIGVGILSLPSDLAMILNTSGWIAIILGGLIILPFVIIINRLFRIYPGMSFFQIGRKVMNPIIFNIFLIIMLSYSLLLLSYACRIFAEVIKAYLLETTPTEVIILTMLIAITYVARSKLEVVARVAVMIYPIILGFIIFLVIVNLPNADYTNIYPLLDVDYKAIPRGIMAVIFSYAGYEILLLALPFSENNKDSLKYCTKGMFIVIGVYLIVFFITLSQYGIHQLQREIWPSIAVIKEIDLPGYFLENLDGIVMAAWVMVVYGTMGPFLYASGVILGSVFNVRDNKFFVPPLVPIIYSISLLPDNLIEVNKVMGRILNYFALASIMVIPTIIFILSYIKRGKNKI